MKKIRYATIITLTIYIITSIFTKEICNLDEIWNFSYANNLANALLPYKEFNMITTPLYAFLNSIILKIFGQKLYIFRITYIVLFILFIYIITKILKLLNTKSLKTNNYLLIITYLLITFTYSDYNFFNMILTSIIIYLEIKHNNNSNTKYNILIGIICSLIFLTKQTTGIFISFTSILIPIIKNKNIKESIIRLLSILPYIVIFSIYLLNNNLLNSFIDLTILGLNTFKKTNFNINIYFLILISTITYLIKTLFKTSKQTNKENIIIIIYSLIALILNYPLLSPTHLIISLIPSSILFISNNNIKLKSNKNAKIITFTIILNFFSIAILNLFSIKNIIEYKNNIIDTNEFKVYQYLISPQEDLKEITTFMKNNNKKVYIIDKDAIVYKTAINEYDQYFDMPLPGNIGTNGEKEMIKILKNTENTILIHDINNLKTDLPKLQNYIIKNYKEQNKINKFYIYEKKFS